MSAPKFVAELPPGGRKRKTGEPKAGVTATIRIIVALAQRVGEWAEVRRSVDRQGVYAAASRWRNWGLDAEVRRDGDDYVLYARIPAQNGPRP